MEKRFQNFNGILLKIQKYYNVKLGRHFVFTGAGLADAIDGATLSYALPFGFNLMAFGGLSLYNEFQSKMDDITYGGRIDHSFYSFLGSTDIGFSFIQKRHKADVERENIGVDFYLSPAQ